MELQQPVSITLTQDCEAGGGDDGRCDHMTFDRKPPSSSSTTHTHTKTHVGETGRPRWTCHHAGIQYQVWITVDQRRRGPERDQVGGFRRTENEEEENDFHFHFLPSLRGPTDSPTDVFRVSVTVWLCCVVPAGQ